MNTPIEEGVAPPGERGAVPAWVARIGAAAGRTVAEAWRAIDPDVKRHVAQTPLLAYSLFAPRHSPVRALPLDGHAPVILVHGLAGRGSAFLPMSWVLSRAGRRRVYRFDYPSASKADSWADLDAHAAALAEYVHEVLAANGELAVELVAHSMGGIVCRLALTDHGLAPVVRSLLTLGTPHGGTWTARFASTGITRALRPDSPLVARLAADGWPEGVRGVTVQSRADVFVLPSESALVEGTEQIDATPFTHYSYLLDPAAWRLVVDHLRPASERAVTVQ